MAAPIAGIHVWADNDNWWDIAATYTGSGLNWVTLAHLNPHITNPNKVPPGTRVNIPRDMTE